MAQDWASTTVVNNHNNNDSKDSVEDDQIIDRLQQPATIPPWIITPDINDKKRQSQLPAKPQTPVIPHHQYLPEAQRSKAARGRRWDHLRDAEPALLDQTLPESSARWLPFMISGPQYHPSEIEGVQVKSDDWMEENVPFWVADEQLARENHQEKHRSFLFDPARRRGSVNHAKVRNADMTKHGQASLRDLRRARSSRIHSSPWSSGQSLLHSPSLLLR